MVKLDMIVAIVVILAIDVESKTVYCSCASGSHTGRATQLYLSLASQLSCRQGPAVQHSG